MVQSRSIFGLLQRSTHIIDPINRLYRKDSHLELYLGNFNDEVPSGN